MVSVLLSPSPFSVSRMRDYFCINRLDIYFFMQKRREKILTGDMRHETHDMWNVTHDIWHMTVGGMWTLIQNFSSLAITVWEWMCFEDIFTKDYWGKPSRRRICISFGWGRGGYNPNQKVSTHFFCLNLEGGVDPNPNTFEALFFLNLNIMKKKIPPFFSD